MLCRLLGFDAPRIRAPPSCSCASLVGPEWHPGALDGPACGAIRWRSRGSAASRAAAPALDEVDAEAPQHGEVKVAVADVKLLAVAGRGKPDSSTFPRAAHELIFDFTWRDRSLLISTKILTAILAQAIVS